MRTIVMLAAALALAACAQDPESSFPDAGGLYRIEGADLYCDGASEAQSIDPDQVTCVWTCIQVEERDVRRVALSFRRESAWSLVHADWELGACEARSRLRGVVADHD